VAFVSALAVALRPQSGGAAGIAVLDSALRLAGNEIRRRIRVSTKFETVPPLEANEARLAELFLTLLLHAARAWPVGGADRCELRVSVRSGSERVEVEFADDLRVMSSDELERLFDPFADSGLWVPHGIVSSLRGTMEVERGESRGAIYRLSFPELKLPTRTERSPRLSGTRKGSERAKVLIVDDEV